METTDYCSYELAKALKAAGFDEPCREFYKPKGDLGSATDADDFNSLGAQYQGEWFSDTISAPTLWHAQKWLREKWGIHVDACVFSDSSTDADGRKCDEWRYWASNIMLVETAQTIVEVDEVCDSYEQALSAGISAALELIKKGE